MELIAEPPRPLGISEGASAALSTDSVREPSRVMLVGPVISLANGREQVRMLGGFGSLPMNDAPMTDATAFVVTVVFAVFPAPVPAASTATGVRGREDSSECGDESLSVSAYDSAESNEASSWLISSEFDRDGDESWAVGLLSSDSLGSSERAFDESASGFSSLCELPPEKN